MTDRDNTPELPFEPARYVKPWSCLTKGQQNHITNAAGVYSEDGGAGPEEIASEMYYAVSEAITRPAPEKVTEYEVNPDPSGRVGEYIIGQPIQPEAPNTELEERAEVLALRKSLAEMHDFFVGDPASDDHEAFEILDRAKALIDQPTPEPTPQALFNHSNTSIVPLPARFKVNVYGHVTEDPNGDWVSAKDYDALRALSEGE